MQLFLLLLIFSTFLSAKTFFEELGPTKWSIGNDLWSIEIGPVYGTKLIYQNIDLAGQAKGFYAGYDGENNFQYTSARIHKETPEYLDVSFDTEGADVHWVIFPDLAGAYQYIVNKQLPVLGVLRTLFRLSNTTFTHGRTHIRDAPLPPLFDFLSAEKVQDETWRRKDGTFITKYDWSALIRDMDFHGVYGNGFGSWLIRPGRDYFNGDHLKQELTVHRESRTGDAVMLNVMHGSHFQADSKADFKRGKIWGPWLWYLNNGSKEDSIRRADLEFKKWPYPWLNDQAYQSRSSVRGRLILSNKAGTPMNFASNVSIFLGDSTSKLSTLSQGRNYYYTTTADWDGAFHIPHVRTGTYALYAWLNGNASYEWQGGISAPFVLNNVRVERGKITDLPGLIWKSHDKRRIFQIGDFDRKTLGFRNGGVPYQHGLVELSPPNLTYTIGKSSESDWYFAQSSLGTWTVCLFFDDFTFNIGEKAVLYVSLAGYSKGANMRIGVNGKFLRTLGGNDIKSDPALYRSGTTAGEWHLFEIEVEKGLLRKGWNEVAFEIVTTKLWRGFMWDSIWMDWEE